MVSLVLELPAFCRMVIWIYVSSQKPEPELPLTQLLILGQRMVCLLAEHLQVTMAFPYPGWRELLEEEMKRKAGSLLGLLNTLLVAKSPIPRLGDFRLILMGMGCRISSNTPSEGIQPCKTRHRFRF